MTRPDDIDRAGRTFPARRLGAASLLMAAVFAATGVAAQDKPAGVAGSAVEPWQEGGAPMGSKTVASLAATVEAMPKNLPRARAPGLDVSIAAARAGVQACAAKGAKLSVLVADAAGEPVVLLSGDGAGVRSQLIARTKANIVVRFHMASGDVAERAKTDPALAAQAAADPAIGLLRGGGFPVLRGGEIVGIVAASGGSLAGGDLTLDETCVRVTLAQLQQAIR